MKQNSTAMNQLASLWSTKHLLWHLWILLLQKLFLHRVANQNSKFFTVILKIKVFSLRRSYIKNCPLFQKLSKIVPRKRRKEFCSLFTILKRPIKLGWVYIGWGQYNIRDRDLGVELYRRLGRCQPIPPRNIDQTPPLAAATWT